MPVPVSKMEMEAISTKEKIAPGEETTPVSVNEKKSAPSSESNEISPLISTKASYKEMKKTPFVYKCVAVGVALLVVAFAIAVNTHNRRTRTPKPIPIEPQEPKMELIFRPYCETYGSTSATIVQTSIGQPSRQWTSVPCYSTNPEHGLFGRPKTAIVDEYQVPDAVLQVDFETPGQVNRSVPILGFGGAFTEAAALNYESLSQTGKDTVMELLFGKSGLGYSLGRVHINSCDFSVKSYTFDETDGDFQLEDFDVGVHHDVEVGMVDMMLRATSAMRTAWASENGVDGDFKVFASPWSPPSWMKAPTPDDAPGAVHAKGMTNSAQPTCLRDGVGPNSKYAEAWALYFSKFLTAYEDLGLPLWAVTIQNEPEFPAPWEACAYTARTQRDFLANHLGPQLRKSHPDVKIFIFDHNKDHAPVWLRTILNSTAAPYVNGTAIHWYAGGMDRLLDGSVGQPNMHRVLSELDDFGVRDDHIILGSEACHCPYTGYAGGDINIAWARAERYAHTILADLAAGSNAWVEWNLILDAKGGPNHLGNLCDTTLLAVPQRALDANPDAPEFQPFEKNSQKFGRVVGNGRTREELNAMGFPAQFLDAGVVVQPMYYYMGHISRHVRPGSIAVRGLVDSGAGKTFRPPGQTFAGGGINDLARDGIELTVWPCEGSTRQEFKLNEHDQLEVSGHDWLGIPTKSCVGKNISSSFLGLVLGTCNRSISATAGTFEVVPFVNETLSYVNIVIKNSNKCLAIKELANGGGAYGPRGGAQVILGNCSDASAQWTVSEKTGEISSSYFEEGDVCLTTGWPFLQMGAFYTPNGETEKTVIILNEAAEGANYILRDKTDIVLTGVIPAHAIQTVMLQS